MSTIARVVSDCDEDGLVEAVWSCDAEALQASDWSEVVNEAATEVVRECRRRPGMYASEFEFVRGPDADADINGNRHVTLRVVRS